MNIKFQRTANLSEAAELTFTNMRAYYELYSVNWDANLIEEKTRDLENYDILFADKVVGVLRLQYENNRCFLRDIQITPAYQNSGIGRIVLNEVKRLTFKRKFTILSLKVFKISAAVEFYKRNGFFIKNEDDRFLYMENEIS